MFFSIPKLQEKLNDTQILRDSSDPEFMMLSLWLHWHCDSSRWIFCGWLKNIGFIHVIDIIIHITIYIMIHILYIYIYVHIFIHNSNSWYMSYMSVYHIHPTFLVPLDPLEAGWGGLRPGRGMFLSTARTHRSPGSLCGSGKSQAAGPGLFHW